MRSVGSSIALSSALQACSVSRSASSTMMICQRRPTGASADAADQVADLVDADRELLGADQRHVGVRAGEHGVALVALAAPGLRPVPALALQRRGERDRGVGAARARVAR